MKKIFVIGILLASCVAQANTFSGFIMIGNDGACRVIWGSGSKDITCKSDVPPWANIARVTLDYSKLELKLPAICTFTNSAVPNEKGSVVERIPLVGNFTTKFTDILLRGETTVPAGGIAGFVCTVSE